MSFIIVIPTYNEKSNIKILIEKLLELYSNYKMHILVVDDNSPDGTAQIVNTYCAKYENIHLLLRKKKEGLGRAYLHGFQESLKYKTDYIIQMDADLSHNPQIIKEMIEVMKKYDVALGSRYVNGVSVINWPLHRILLSWFASYYVRFVTGMSISDTTGGFKCFKRSVLENIHFDKIKSDGYGFQVEVNYILEKKGYKIKEIPIIFIDRDNGSSKMSYSIIIEALFLVLFLRFKRIKSYFHQ